MISITLRCGSASAVAPAYLILGCLMGTITGADGLASRTIVAIHGAAVSHRTVSNFDLEIVGATGQQRQGC